jgi:hypothetical protein
MAPMARGGGLGRADGVVLIHALGRSRWSMWPMARRLRAAGWLNAPSGLDGPNDVPVSHTFLPASARAARLVAAFLRVGSFDRAQEGER